MNRQPLTMIELKPRHQDELRVENERLRTALMLVLDHVDYTAGNCRLTEMVGGALPQVVIKAARDALKGGE